MLYARLTGTACHRLLYIYSLRTNHAPVTFISKYLFQISNRAVLITLIYPTCALPLPTIKISSCLDGQGEGKVAFDYLDSNR